jgi:hypothetical protein
MGLGGMKPGADVSRPVRISWRDVAPGLSLVAIAAVTFYAGRSLPGLTGFSPGPGTFPYVLSAMLLALGLVVGLESYLSKSILVTDSFVPAIVVTGAVAAFALTVGELGIAVASGLTVAIVGVYGLRSRPAALALVVVGTIVVVVAASVLSDHSQLLWPIGRP